MDHQIEIIYLVAGLISMLLLACTPLAVLLQHGRSVSTTSSSFYVSKNQFKWFYLVGILFGIHSISKQPSILCILFFGHVTRRYFETVYLFNSQTKMHVLHLIVGMSFYPIVWRILLQGQSTAISSAMKTMLSSAFLGLNYVQFQCHSLMSANKIKSKLPDHWLFKRLVCPNFLCEILLYLVVALWTRTISSTLLLLFVACNQIISAVDRKSWYPETDVPIWAIIPGII